MEWTLKAGPHIKEQSKMCNEQAFIQENKDNMKKSVFSRSNLSSKKYHRKCYYIYKDVIIPVLYMLEAITETQLSVYYMMLMLLTI